MIRTLLLLFQIHDHSFWKFRACILEVLKLADIVQEVIQEMHLHIIEIKFVSIMLCTFSLNLSLILTKTNTHGSGKKIFAIGVTLPIFVLAHKQLLFHGFQVLLCRITAQEMPHNILLTMKLHQIIHHVLNRGISMAPVLDHQLKTH
jgi:hypothetical protein